MWLVRFDQIPTKSQDNKKLTTPKRQETSPATGNLFQSWPLNQK